MIKEQTSEVQHLQLISENVCKSYDLRPVLTNISLRLERGSTLGITGHNGSGKSTLLKIFANVLEKTSGRVEWQVGKKGLKEENLPQHLGYVAPYLELYSEFTVLELLDLLGQMRGTPPDQEYASLLLDRFGLANRTTDAIQAYSSGMKQRVKYVLALSHHPCFLMLDEPMTNLDEDGQAVIREILLEEQANRITVIATNEKEDLKLCTHKLALD